MRGSVDTNFEKGLENTSIPKTTNLSTSSSQKSVDSRQSESVEPSYSNHARYVSTARLRMHIIIRMRMRDHMRLHC